mgnify:CR=1 FL=1
MEFFYFYRDADNYKTFNSIILEGELTKEQINHMKSILHEGEYFLPIDVGVSALYPAEPDLDIDHIWHTWGHLEPIKKERCDRVPDMSAQTFYERFIKTQGHWNEDFHNALLWG